MLFRVMRTWAVGFSFCVASLCAGCTVSPAIHSNGLPRITRYTNPLQLEWALSRYSTLAVSSPQASPSLAQEACQGWRKMTFDLASARQYPRMLRMSGEAAGLLAAIDELPAAMSRHPLPLTCQANTSPLTVAAAPVPAVAVPPTPPAASQLAQAESPPPAVSVPVASSAAQSPVQFDATPTPNLAPTSPTASAVAQSVPPPAPPTAPQAVPVVVQSAPQQPTITDDMQEQWERLIQASGVGTTAADLAAARQPQANLQELSALADSPIPAIRLRARFHLLGQCASALAATERLGQPEAAAPFCVGRQGNEPLHITQRRLLRSMLGAWRGRGPEPFSDWIVALASFASRDNPVLDGPRIAR
jgi:hypothetical protein